MGGWWEGRGKPLLSLFILEAQPVNGFLCRRLPTTEKRRDIVFTTDSLSYGCMYVPVTIPACLPARLPQAPLKPL